MVLERFPLHFQPLDEDYLGVHQFGDAEESRDDPRGHQIENQHHAAEFVLLADAFELLPEASADVLAEGEELLRLGVGDYLTHVYNEEAQY